MTRGGVLDGCVIELPYIPDFLLDDLRFWFVPSRDECREVYHELVGRSAENWSTYYSKKGWNFIHDPAARDAAEGPFSVRPGEVELDILEPGRIFAPKPRFSFERGGPSYPLVSIEKRRPINPWKPQFIRALEFIRKYEWPYPVSRRAQAAIWEIEECGEIAGSTSWINAESLLLRSDSENLRKTLSDIFYNRPETYPLGSQVYLRVLGRLGREGFEALLELARHPITRKRVAVAKALGDPSLGEAIEPDERHRLRIETLFLLLEDEDPAVRSAALRSMANEGLREGDDPEGKVAAFVSAPEISHRVWAARALSDLDEEQRKFLIGLVKEDPRPLTDLGELGEIIVESKLYDVVPYLIQRLKSEDRQVVIDAAEVLQKLSGIEIEVTAAGADEEKREALRQYNRWWEEIKRERRQKKLGDE
ncbi:MAG TPA: hypothetical protein VK116_17735 [Planctomycetota bacterium]|nr:hypothetical protein [Planctomycetota bacterium]